MSEDTSPLGSKAPDRRKPEVRSETSRRYFRKFVCPDFAFPCLGAFLYNNAWLVIAPSIFRALLQHSTERAAKFKADHEPSIGARAMTREVGGTINNTHKHCCNFCVGHKMTLASSLPVPFPTTPTLFRQNRRRHYWVAQRISTAKPRIANFRSGRIEIGRK